MRNLLLTCHIVLASATAAVAQTTQTCGVWNTSGSYQWVTVTGLKSDGSGTDSLVAFWVPPWSGRDVQVTYAVSALQLLLFNANFYARFDATVTQRIPGDVNGDGLVDVSDLLAFAAAWDSVDGMDSWNSACDFLGKGCVDIDNLLLLAANFGRSRAAIAKQS